MHKFIASTPQAEIKGYVMTSFLQCIQHEELTPILEKYDLGSLDPDRWYLQQISLDIFRDIAQGTFNVTEDLVSIGMKVVDLLQFPPAINSVESALMGLRMAYQAEHRYNTEEGWIIDIRGSGKALVTADNPYPEDQNYGVLWALVRRFKPANSTFAVIRKQPDDPEANTVYEITWEV